jgi:hypothetical protein
MNWLRKLERLVLNFLKLMIALDWQAGFAGRGNDQARVRKAIPTPKATAEANRTKLLKILKAHGIAVELWPSA